MPHDIIDNSNVKLIEVLKEKLSVSKKARFAVGWLFLSGFKELRNEIDNLEKLEILAGSRTNKQTAEVIRLEKKWEKAVKDTLERTKYLTEEERQKILDEEFKGLMNDLSYIKPTLEDIEFLKWFLEKLREGKIEIRIYYKEPLHAKLYLFEYKDQRHGLGEAIVGSSNFSLSGFNLNTELNVRVLGDENYRVLRDWFEERWKESEKTQFTELAEKAIEKSWAFNREVTPFRVYLKILHEIFSYQEEEKIPEIEGDLFHYQKDAVIDAYRRLNKFNGVFIADVPGLGKTHMGSALLAHLETEGKFAIVIVPPRLIEFWEETLRDRGATKAKVFSNGKLEDILNDEKLMSTRKVVLIDESHHFRNPDTKRYRNIERICYGKQVILLSATPQNLSIWDIYWQLKLFTPYETNHNFRIYPISLKEYFKKCESGEANIEDLIAQIFIRRTRSDIKEYYPHEKIIFPERKGPYRVDYSIDKVYEGGLYQKINEFLPKLTYARYDLSRYAIEEKFDPDYFQRLTRAWQNLHQLVKINLYRRLESSVQAFRDTINTYLKITGGFLEIIEKENKVPVGDIDDIEDIVERLKNDEEIEWKEFENYFDASYFRIDKLKEDLKKDYEIFNEMAELVKDIKPEDDDKLQKLIEILKKDPIKDKKILIFSTFESTVKYLYENLKNKFEKVDYVAGGREIMSKIKRFSPKANRANIKPEEEIKILISTEVLSEGLNLQDGQVIINYELHWNPVRIIQRIGRIDRIGSQYDEIYVYNFFPETEAEKGINLEQKVRNRIEDIIKNFGYDEKTISLDEATVRKKLFEIYTERPEGLEEIEKQSPSKYFELEFKRLKERYPQEYEKAKELPNMVHIAKKDDKKGVIVFCRAGNWFKLKMVDERGELITADDWEILKLLECKPETKGIEFDLNKLDIIEKTREIFEKEANDREKDRVNIIHPVKKEFEKLIEWLKRKEPESIKKEFGQLLDFVIKKSLTFTAEKELRSIIRSYAKKFGLDKRQILKELKEKIYNLLQNLPDEKIEKPIYQYAEVIVVEELK